MDLHKQNPLNSVKIDHSLIAGRTSDGIKLAHRAAALLQQEIIFGRFESGRSLGTAAEIRSRHNLGRWAFREAVGILELRGVARLRPGPGGGVVVAEPDLSDLVNLTLLYLAVTPKGMHELVEVQQAVLAAVVKKLLHMPLKTGPSNKWVADNTAGNFIRFLARQTGNAAIKLAVEFVESVREACMANPTSDEGNPELEQQLWQAIHAKDSKVALAALSQLLAERGRSILDADLNLADLSKHAGGMGKSAYRLALRMLQVIVEHPEEWASSLGSEAAMCLRFGANGEIVRQAVRLIEDLEVVAPRRGRNGGIMLRRPGTASIASLLPHLLAKKRLPVSQCFEAAALLNVEIARLAAMRAKSRPLAKAPETPDDEVDAWGMILLDRRVQAFAGNPLLASIERGLLFYSCVVEPPGPVECVPLEKMVELSQSILRAIEDADVERAEAISHERFEFMSLRFSAPGYVGAEPRFS